MFKSERRGQFDNCKWVVLLDWLAPMPRITSSLLRPSSWWHKPYMSKDKEHREQGAMVGV